MTSTEAQAEYASSLTGLYVHVPFCRRKCGYCDFAAFAGLEDVVDDYLKALRAEVEGFFGAGGPAGYEKFFDGSSGSTLYVGGGTPTLVDVPALAGALEPLLAMGPCEVSVEANPDTVDRRKAVELSVMGVSRVSLGVQSFDPAVLGYLDRTHDRRSVAAAVEALLGAGISNTNLDLIYGAPMEGMASWEGTLQEAVGCGATHISCYALSLEKGTSLWRRVLEGGEAGPDPDDQAAKMALAGELLESEGYVRYEVSAWARPGFECLHNLVYWGFGRYRGFGSGAHSFDGSKRFWNPCHPRAYIRSADAGELPAGDERLDGETLAFDRISLGLRRSVGIPWPDGTDRCSYPETTRLVEAGLAKVTAGRLRPTPKGMALLNDLVLAVVSDRLGPAVRPGCVLSLSGSG